MAKKIKLSRFLLGEGFQGEGKCAGVGVEIEVNQWNHDPDMPLRSVIFYATAVGILLTTRIFFAEAVFDPEKEGDEFPPADRLMRQSGLPDPFLKPDGTRVTSLKAWSRQRDYLKALLAYYQYGRMPNEKPETRLKKVGPSLKYELTLERLGKKAVVRFELYKPNGKGPFPVIIKNDRVLSEKPEILQKILARGYVLCKFNREDFAPDVKKGFLDKGVYPLYPDADWRTLAVWAWGYQRIIDCLETMDFIDREKIVATGHSRGGKTALCAGIYDERIALTAPNSSGTGGTGSWRYFNPKIKRNQSMDFVAKNHPHWYGPRLPSFFGQVERLPFDAHFQKALIAPRGFFNAHGTEDDWANPWGTEITHRAAQKVYAWLGVEKNIALHWRKGGHAQGLLDWLALLDFADAYFFGQEVESGDYDFKRNQRAFPKAELKMDWEVPRKL